MPTDAIECPLCLGEGKLKRTEVLDRLGVKDLARVAQLSAEEAFRLLLGKHKDDQQSVWLRFEAELAKRMAEIRDRHKDELHATQSERDNLTRRVEDCLREFAQLRERNQELEAEMSKVSRIGKREEMDFADEARTWAGVSVSEKLPRNGDFIVAYRDPSGASVEPRMLVDNKDKAVVTEGDIAKLVRDAKERSLSVAVLVARTEEQLRQIDRECRWGEKDGVWILRTTRQWLPRDLEVLKPLLERMRTEGPDFLQRNAALAEEVRRTFADIDAIEKELGKASKAIQSVSGLVAKYKVRLNSLCDRTGAAKKLPTRQRDRSDIPQSVGAL
jgi:predicted nuclease with TOPRIM domain